jgi:hypothetical protein
MRRSFWVIFFVFGCYFSGQTQEVVIGLGRNLAIHHNLSFKQTQASALELPFFDDFKQSSSDPNPNLWADRKAFVNTGFQKFPANYGVATLDALDENGEIYSDANSFSFIADYLTSNPIRLDSLSTENRSIKRSDSLYLSFYYQPQGRGNAPESSDSLVLEFYSGRDQLWYPIWSDAGMPLDSFLIKNKTYCKQVMIAIKDSAKYYYPDFRFRFYNYASLADPIQKTWQSNADQWNIDYVKLDRGRSRNDIYSKDLSFVNVPPSFLKRYRNIPYNQYKNDPTNSMSDSLHSIYISNLDGISYSAEYQYVISGQTEQDSVYSGGAANIYPFISDGYAAFPRFSDPKVISFFSVTSADQKEFIITHRVKTLANNPVQSGDTLIQKQFFGDFFAYDDGSAEAGYGLSNLGSAALRFKMNTPDTLTSVKFYFNPSRQANEDYFYLNVWQSLDPEVLLYQKLVKVEASTGQNGFIDYPLDEIVIVSNDFYVGFTQTTSDNLNIGFDLSFSPENSLLYNSGSGWYPSIYEGALMVRPVFSNSNLGNEVPISSAEKAVSIFPNPLKSGVLNVELENSTQYLIKIYSLLGKLVYSHPFQQQINLDFLKEGVYLLRFENQLNGEVKSKKLIIN